jgi:hypothetical protein
MFRTGYVILEREFEYNDEFYEVRGALPRTVYATEARARKDCARRNAEDPAYAEDHHGKMMDTYTVIQVRVVGFNESDDPNGV